MANKITSETVLNPSGVFDISSCIVTEAKSDLVISDCMSLITKYVFLFWIRSENYNYNVIFNCDTTSKVIVVTPEWQYFFIVFDVENISNIILTFPKGKFYVYNTKLEIGSLPTDWSPHPEDGNLLYRELNGKVEQLLIQNTSTVDRMTNLVDKVNMTIENSMSRTEYQTSINGILSSIDEDIENLKDGENKWYVTIYNKADFNKLTKLPDEETDWSDIDNPNQSDDEPDDPSPTEEPDDIDTLEADDRDRYDMKIFMLENGDLNPIDEYAVDDNNIAMRIDGKGRVIYYYTFVKFGKDYKATLSCSFRKATCYLNGTQLISESITDTMDVIFDFKTGWNLIEIISNEGNFSFKSPISKMDECLRMNYAVAVPTSRNVKMQVKGSGIYQNLDRILSEVYKYEIEYYTDSNGLRKSRKVMKQSRIKLTADMIQLLVKDIFGNYSEFTLTPQFIQAITQQFIVTDPITGERVIILNGLIQANSIDSTLLSTDAIRSRNFDGGVVKQREAIDPDTGETVMEDYIDLDDIDFDPEKNRIFPAHGTFLDLANGNYYSPNMVLINEYERRVEDEEATGGVRIIDVINKAYFKGDVYADTLTTNSGNIGPWHITDTSLYRGVDALGQREVSTTSQGRSYNSYMGDLGFSISDVIVYDASNDSLTLRPNSLELSAPDVLAITALAINGNTIYYRQTGAPTKDNEPWIYWNSGECTLHLDELCYRMDTGELYRFEKKVNGEGNSVLYAIYFNSNSRLRTGASSAIDYVEIYYRYGNPSTIYRVAKRFASSASFEDPVIIPTDEFYVYLHIEDYQSSGIVDYYGFSIDQIRTTTGQATADVTIIDSEEKRRIIAEEEASLSTGNVSLAINDNIPNYPLDELDIGELPETLHPYPHNKRDKLWYVKSGVSNQEDYQWVKIENAELIEAAANARKALSYMHYDAVNGLIFHNGQAENMPNDIWTVNDLQKLNGGNARLTTSGMDIYNGNTLLAHYGNTTEFYKYLNGTRYTAATLGADGFLVVDGKAGGINIVTDAIYSTGHDSVDDMDTGFYLGANGTFSVGGSNGMLKLKDNTLTLTFNGSSVATQSDLSSLESLISSAMGGDVSALLNQIDEKIQSWNQPSTSNPASSWSANTDKAKHVGDMWHQTDTGLYYVYKDNGNNSYSWEEMNAVSSSVLGIINSKANIYTNASSNPPANPSQGDLWFLGTGLPILTYVNNSWIEYSNSSKTATSYMVADSKGLRIYRDTSNTTNKSNILINGESMQVCKGDWVLTEYGSSILFYAPESYSLNALTFAEPVMVINSEGVNIYEGSINLGWYEGGLSSGDDKYHFSVDSNGNLYSEQGTIGGMTIASDKLYSGSRNSYFSHDAGTYIDNNGQVSVGSKFYSNPQSKWYSESFFASGGRFGVEGYSSANNLLYHYAMVLGYSSYYDSSKGTYEMENSLDNSLRFYKDTELLMELRGTEGLISTGELLLSNSMRKQNTNTMFSINTSTSNPFVTTTDNVNQVSMISFVQSESCATYNSRNYTTVNWDNVLYYSNAVQIYNKGNDLNAYISFGGNYYGYGYLQLSDERNKNILSYMSNNYVDLFMSIKPIVYTWKNDYLLRIHFGVGAQTMSSSISNLGYDNLCIVDDSNYEHLNVDYTELLMLSVPVVLLHETEIIILKKEIESLKGEIKRLREKVR